VEVEDGVNMLHRHILVLVFLADLVVVESKDLVVELEIEKLEHLHLPHHKEMMVDRVFLHHPFLVVVVAVALVVQVVTELHLLAEMEVQDLQILMLMDQRIQ